MSKIRITTLFLSLFLPALIVIAQEEKEKPTEAAVEKTIPEMTADLKTVKDLDRVELALNEKRRQGFKKAEDYKDFLKLQGEAYVAMGEKQLEWAKDDKDREWAYNRKIMGLKDLVRWEDFGRIPGLGDETYQRKLEALLDELDKNEAYRKLVNNERFQLFHQGMSKLYRDLTPEKFEAFKAEAKKWANTKPADYEPYRPLSLIMDLAAADPRSKENPKFSQEVAAELIAFVKSDELKVSDEEKAKAVERLQGYCRRCMGADLDLYGKTLDDKDFDWKALRGKYVLVKFTASWCGPCKGEIPGMLEAYEKYKDKDFEIVSVFIWDKLDAVKKTVEHEKLPWIIVSEELTEKAGKSKQGDAFAIRGVPTMLLVDKDGKVIDTAARGAALKKKLVELLDK